jgi:hypothetical protein
LKGVSKVRVRTIPAFFIDFVGLLAIFWVFSFYFMEYKFFASVRNSVIVLVPLVVSQLFLIDFRFSIDYFCESFSFYLIKICYFFMNFSGNEKYEFVLSQYFLINFKWLLAIFVSVLVLSDKNLLFFVLVLFVVSQPRNSETW